MPQVTLHSPIAKARKIPFCVQTVSITLNCPFAPHWQDVAPDWSYPDAHSSATSSPTEYVCIAGTITFIGSFGSVHVILGWIVGARVVAGFVTITGTIGLQTPFLAKYPGLHTHQNLL